MNPPGSDELVYQFYVFHGTDHQSAAYCYENQNKLHRRYYLIFAHKTIVRLASSKPPLHNAQFLDF